MDKRSLWWTAVVVIVFETITRAISTSVMQSSGAANLREPLIASLVSFIISAGLLAWFVALVNEKRRWPLILMIAMQALWITLCIAWILSADENGRILSRGVTYPVSIWWVSLVGAVLAAGAFTWHFRLYKRTVWLHKSRAKDRL